MEEPQVPWFYTWLNNPRYKKYISLLMFTVRTCTLDYLENYARKLGNGWKLLRFPKNTRPRFPIHTFPKVHQSLGYPDCLNEFTTNPGLGACVAQLLQLACQKVEAFWPAGCRRQEIEAQHQKSQFRLRTCYLHRYNMVSSNTSLVGWLTSTRNPRNSMGD